MKSPAKKRAKKKTKSSESQELCTSCGLSTKFHPGKDCQELRNHEIVYEGLTVREHAYVMTRLAEPGMPRATVYMKIYGVENRTVAMSAASRLERVPRVANAISEIKHEAAKAATLTVADLIRFYERVIAANPADLDPDSDLCQGFDRGGNPVLPCKIQAGKMLAELQGWTKREEKKGTLIQINVHDRLKGSPAAMREVRAILKEVEEEPAG